MNKKLFQISSALLTIILGCTAKADNIKIGHQFFDVRPITITGKSKISAVGMPSKTAKLAENNIVETEPGKYSVIIRDRIVLAYFIGSLNSRGLLTDHIIYTCRVKNCKPTDKATSEINRHTNSYAINAESLDEWYQLIKMLESNPDVRAVFPTFIRDAKKKHVIKNIKGLQEKNFYNSAEDD